jgi:hypothetical protein
MAGDQAFPRGFDRLLRGLSGTGGPLQVQSFLCQVRHQGCGNPGSARSLDAGESSLRCCIKKDYAKYRENNYAI